MKQFSLLVSLILAASLFMVACGEQAPSQVPADPPQGESPTSAPTAMPTEMVPTEAPATPTDAPATPTDPAPDDSPVEVQVTLGDNWIKSSQTTFKVGVTYRFIITNTGRRNHMFDIAKPAEKTTSAIREALANALLSISDKQLPPGAQVTTDFTFAAPAGPGELEFACHIEKHYKDGQYLAILVEP